ncbi:protein jag [Dehalococcoidia bacterium]|nr:protein jag [Dehalococcoidia bacterium]MCL0075422.1 protein jag [Dehalococcoidia bacterium]
MEALEVSAKTVEEAVGLALNELNLTRSEVEIEVLQEGKTGILGWRGEDARVRVTPLPSPEEGGNVAAIAREVVEKLLSLVEVDATVQVSGGEDDQSPLSIDVSNGDLGVLIGRRGQTLASLQYMVNIIIGRKLKSGVRVIVDVAGYRKRRDEELQNMTLRVAELVKSTRRSITLEPMPAMERRVVHLALRDDPDLATQSVGFGDSRKVVIYPKRQREQY